MKASVQDEYGSADTLKLQDIESPVPKDDEMLVRVHAVGVDPGVWHLMMGEPYLIRAMGFGLRKPKFRVRGWDVAGRVEEVGAKITRFKPGDEVFGTCEGSFAEYACAQEDKCAPKPANLTFEQAAAVPVSAVTALTALRDKGQLREGQKVLIIGAGGGVGTYAMQLAKAFGANVTGVCSTAKADLVRSIGDDVIDYTRDDFAGGGRRYDLILDVAGLRPLSHLRRALAAKGTIVFIGGEGGGRWTGGLGRQLRAAGMAPFVGQKMRSLFATVRSKDLKFLTELIEAGRVTPVIDRTFSLSEAPEAVRYLEKGRARGKIVLTV